MLLPFGVCCNPRWTAARIWDLWLFFPGCGIDVAAATRKVEAKRIVFGHLWELGHRTGRLTTPMIRKALVKAEPACKAVSAALWGDRVL